MWQLNISYKKCAILGIGNNITNHAFSIATIPIINVHAVKDLGILVDESVSFSSHIRHIVTRAFTRANSIHKCFVSKHTPTLVRAFITYVRPLLEYASSSSSWREDS